MYLKAFLNLDLGKIYLRACFNGAIFGDEHTIFPSVLTEKDLGFGC